MSFFDPVYQNDDESDGELSVNSLSRQTFRDKNNDESNETLDADPRINLSSRNDDDDDDDTLDQDQSLEVRRKKNIIIIIILYYLDFYNKNCCSYKTNSKFCSASTNNA